MRSVIVGASAGLGRSLAECLARKGSGLFLVASHGRDLAALAADLTLRHGVGVGWLAQDLGAPGCAQEIRRAALEFLGGIDNLFLVAGFSSLDDRGALPPEMVRRLLEVNLVAPIELANAFLADLEDNPKGNIAFMGSVASIRPRRRNAVYGAAKTGLEFYAGALRHHLAAKPCRVQHYRLGYLATQMTFGQKLPFPALAPTAAAERIVAGLGTDPGVVYLPGFWRFIGLILNTVPWRVFKGLDI